MTDSKKISVLDIENQNLTPGMKQYQEVKRAHPDCLVMLRMGDFFEMFYEDAITASRELEITLTARGQGEKRAPLAGIPYHALEGYLGKLVKRGYKVAIVEQLEDPKLAKGLVKRGLVRIVTPGTVIESSLLNEKENNYIVALTCHGEEGAIACSDASTGEFFTISTTSRVALLGEMVRLAVSECLIPKSLGVDREFVDKLKQICFVNPLEDYYFKFDKARSILLEQFSLPSLDPFGLEDKKMNISVCGALVYYLRDTQKTNLHQLQKIMLHTSEQMIIDGNTFRNLELLKNMKDGSVRGTLLSVLDKTVTAMGARRLRQWISTPLLNQQKIESRLNALEELQQHFLEFAQIISTLKGIADIERLISRVNFGNATPRDLIMLKQTLQILPAIRTLMSDFKSPLLQQIALTQIHEEVEALLENSIREDSPTSLREGGIIKPEFDPELRELWLIKTDSRQYLAELERREKERTGINTLKVGYTRVFGYFIEVTRKNASLVPKDYERRQTTANSERFVTADLKEAEAKILGAEEKIVELEYALFQRIVAQIARETTHLQETAYKLSVLDTLCSLAYVARERRYVRPRFVEENKIEIIAGRHPVVEELVDRFIANDLVLAEAEMMIITGPNMAGKSTIMRQVALIIVMAQMGSFVPATRVQMSIADRIFSRVGAYDDLSSGQSTFLVEMNETASILHNATERSFIILDEIGRGTSTFDGVSIAWSVAEYIYHQIRAKTLFATHYHVLNKMEEKLPRIKNYNVAVQEVGSDIVFLHKLIKGGTDQSYGIHVAKLAGLPKVVLDRAREIQSILEKDDDMVRRIKVKKLDDQRSIEEF